MWHQAFFLTIEVLAAMGIGWMTEELLCLPSPQHRHRSCSSYVVEQARAMHEIDGITTAAVAQLVRIAGEELSYA